MRILGVIDRSVSRATTTPAAVTYNSAAVLYNSSATFYQAASYTTDTDVAGRQTVTRFVTKLD